jgi:hypothetical protein
LVLQEALWLVSKKTRIAVDLNEEDLEAFNRLTTPLVVPFGVGTFIASIYVFVAEFYKGRRPEISSLIALFSVILFPSIVLLYRMWKNYGWFCSVDRKQNLKQIFGLTFLTTLFAQIIILLIRFCDANRGFHVPLAATLSFDIPLTAIALISFFRWGYLTSRPPDN